MRHRVIAAALVAAVAWAWLPAMAARADFQQQPASPEARHVADWAVHSRDHGDLPFAIVDKVQSRVFVFTATGDLLGAAPALLGLAFGDHSAPGIGTREMSRIRPEERTTPAGRFVATLAPSLQGDDILWIDYDTAIALHRVTAAAPRDRRLQRLDSGTSSDRRITYGCINVSTLFFDTVVAPAFKAGSGIVYVLPETRRASEVFGSYDVDTAPAGR